MAIIEDSLSDTSASSACDVETGSFTIDENSRAASSKLVIATFNLRYAVGSFLISGSLLRRIGLGRPRRRPALVARHISLAAGALSNGVRMPPADIIALQEADRCTIRAGGRHVARELAQALKMNYARAGVDLPPNEAPQSKQWYLDFEEHIPPGDAGDTGVALLSRLPLAHALRIDLPWSQCAWRPRLALAAEVFIKHRKLSIFNSHIDPHARLADQLAQHEAVLQRADEANAAGPVVLLGDFNTLTRRSCVEVRRLLESHGYSTPLPTGTATWRAGLIRLHADWIFVRGAQVTRWGVARRLSVSDHWPVWIEIDTSTGADEDW